MYVVINRLACPAGYADHLERAFRHAGNMQGVQGFVSFMFLRQDEGETERRHFVAITTWESSRSYEGWLKSEAFANVHAGAEASLIESTVERYDVLA